MKKQDLDKESKKLGRETDALIAKPDFQADVTKLREKWNIPKGGFTATDDTQNWHHWLSEQTDNWYHKEWPKYREALLKLKETGKFLEYEKENKRVNKLAPINALNEDIGAILRKYRLRPSLKDGIRGYLLTNHLGSWLGITIRTVQDELTGFTELHLIITENTTIKDIKAVWSMVNFHQSKLQYKKRQQRIKPKLDRNKRAYELLEVEGYDGPKVAELLGDELGEVFIANDVYDFVRRYKEQTGIK